MTKAEYLKRALDAYNEGRIDADTYDAMVMNADIFTDDTDEHSNLPATYAEVEYSDFDSPEAVDGARFDDMNYLRYTER